MSFARSGGVVVIVVGHFHRCRSFVPSGHSDVLNSWLLVLVAATVRAFCTGLAGVMWQRSSLTLVVVVLGGGGGVDALALRLRTFVRDASERVRVSACACGCGGAGGRMRVGVCMHVAWLMRSALGGVAWVSVDGGLSAWCRGRPRPPRQLAQAVMAATLLGCARSPGGRVSVAVAHFTAARRSGFAKRACVRAGTRRCALSVPQHRARASAM